MNSESVSVPVDVIGSWLHGNCTVLETAARDDFWDSAELSEEELRARISHGFYPDCPLEAFTTPYGMMLADGCHRWAVADQLGIAELPVVVYEFNDGEAERAMNGCFLCAANGE